MIQGKQHPAFVCRHCSKEHPRKFIRCLRCGRLRYDIGIDAILTKFFFAAGIVVLFISLYILCKSLYTDQADLLGKTEVLEKNAMVSMTVALLACMAGTFFYYRVKNKKNEEV